MNSKLETRIQKRGEMEKRKIELDTLEEMVNDLKEVSQEEKDNIINKIEWIVAIYEDTIEDNNRLIDSYTDLIEGYRRVVRDMMGNSFKN